MQLQPWCSGYEYVHNTSFDIFSCKRKKIWKFSSSLLCLTGAVGLFCSLVRVWIENKRAKYKGLEPCLWWWRWWNLVEMKYEYLNFKHIHPMELFGVHRLHSKHWTLKPHATSYTVHVWITRKIMVQTKFLFSGLTKKNQREKTIASQFKHWMNGRQEKKNTLLTESHSDSHWNDEAVGGKCLSLIKSFMKWFSRWKIHLKKTNKFDALKYTTNRKNRRVPTSKHYSMRDTRKWFFSSPHKYSSNATIENLITGEKKVMKMLRCIYRQFFFFVVVIWAIEFWIQYEDRQMAIHLRHIKIDNEHAFELQLQRLINKFFWISSHEKKLLQYFLVLLASNSKLVIFLS